MLTANQEQPPLSPELPDSVIALEELVSSQLGQQALQDVHRAFLVGAHAHHGQTRKSGEPYILHPVAVARILADMAMDSETLIAAILHDTIEDTPLTKEEVVELFGEVVGEIVDGVTKLDKVRFSTQLEAAAESFRKMMLAMSKDIRVILIKLADRLHNMRTLGVMRPEKKRRIAKETLDIYAPIAHRLGMDIFKRELQNLSFQNLYPKRHEVITNQVRMATGRNEERLNTIQNALQARLNEEGIPCVVDGRGKSPYSIYNKMKTKTASFHDVLDVLGFRIVVDTVGQCYQALGIVHNLYKPRSSRFKDYIAIPKSNGYQGLHTVLFGPFGDPIEIQIRTKAMDTVAERGIAAHWAYKLEEGANTANRAREWLLGLLDMQKQAGDSIEFLEHVKVDLFPDELYVFTPKGAIKELPRNATALDFAYAVHTDVGNHAVSAWVDKKVVPLRHRLNSGETVKIVTTKSAQPRAGWLENVVTSKARTAIRHFLKNLAHEEAVQIGHLMLDKALIRLGASLDNIGDERINHFLNQLKMQRLEELLAEIALGNRMPSMAARQLLEAEEEAQTETDQHENDAIVLTGSEAHVVSYGNCCHPIPGDPIMGYLSAGKGTVVHRTSCSNMKELRKSKDRWVSVVWSPDESGLYSVWLKIEVNNKPGVLAIVASSIAETDTNIEHVENRAVDAHTAQLLFMVIVKNRQHLARVMRRIRRSGLVISVHRGQ